MLRGGLTEQLDQDPDFKWRGGAVSRIENLSDIVFALALGLIVSARPVAFSYAGLNDHLVNLIPVAAGAAVLFAIWDSHFIFFRRYGLADRTIVALNAALLLLILFLAMPLRLVFDSFFAWIIGQTTEDWTRMQSMGIDSYAQAGVIMAYFGGAFALVRACLSQMYARALHKRDSLALEPVEIAMTRYKVWTLRFDGLIGVAIAIIALLTPVGPFAGFMMVVSWPASALIRRLNRPRAQAVLNGPGGDAVAAPERASVS